MTGRIKIKSDLTRTGDGLKAWFALPLGSHILDREREILDDILPDLFGYHFMQLGLLSGDRFLGSTKITHRVRVQLEGESAGPDDAEVACAPEALPVAGDTVDVVVLPHVLEYCQNPHKVLREIERVLIGDGHLVITGFNPWSLCGLWKLLSAWRREPPWTGHFFSYNRLKDWFTLLDLEIVRHERCFYRPPLYNMRFMERLSFLEKLGGRCWSIFGGVYVIVVRKRVIPLTPVKDLWQKGRGMIESGLAEPTTRCFRDSR